MRKIYISVKITLATIWITLGILPVSGQSNLTHPYEELFKEVLLLSFVVFSMVLILWMFNIVKYGQHTGKEPEEYNEDLLKKFQITWIVIPILIGILLLALSLPALASFRDNLDYQGSVEEVVVEGTGAWQWKFYYENQTFLPVVDENDISTTTLELTAGQAYRFILYSSSNLIHSFFVPELNFKQDVVPHKNNTITIVIEESGEYPILCAEYCGARHSMMRGIISVVDA